MYKAASIRHRPCTHPFTSARRSSSFDSQALCGWRLQERWSRYASHPSSCDPPLLSILLIDDTETLAFLFIALNLSIHAAQPDCDMNRSNQLLPHELLMAPGITSVSSFCSLSQLRTCSLLGSCIPFPHPLTEDNVAHSLLCRFWTTTLCHHTLRVCLHTLPLHAVRSHHHAQATPRAHCAPSCSRAIHETPIHRLKRRVLGSAAATPVAQARFRVSSSVPWAQANQSISSLTFRSETRHLLVEQRAVPQWTKSACHLWMKTSRQARIQLMVHHRLKQENKKTPDHHTTARGQ